MTLNTEWGAIFKELGARPIINAIGSLTLVGGSTPPIEVREAMEAANDAYIPLTDLEDAAGAVIAKAINVPAAYVTSGAGSALTLAAAAAMAGDDDDKIERLPQTAGMKSEILIQERHRYWYDRCLEASGATLVNFGSAEGTSPDDLRNAIGSNTAAVHFVMKEEAPDLAALSLEETIAIANEAGIPTLVDGAGQRVTLQLFCVQANLSVILTNLSRLFSFQAWVVLKYPPAELASVLAVLDGTLCFINAIVFRA